MVSQGLIVSRTLVGAMYAATLAMWVVAPEQCTQLIRGINDHIAARDGVLLSTLERIGVPPPYPNAVNVAWGLFSIALALLTVAAVVQPKQRARAEELRQKLARARDEVEALHEQLWEIRDKRATERAAATAARKQKDAGGGAGGTGGGGDAAGKEKPIRIFMEGAFDIMHYGHMNAFRQGAALGDVLVVGVNSSASIEACKGTRPVMSDQERCAAVNACRFVDEVIEKTPYVMTREYLDWVIKEYDIDFVVHGDDPCYVDGRDVYEDVKKRGMFRSIPVTEGVSTTDIVGRMLLLHKEHHIQVTPDSDDEQRGGSTDGDADASADDGGETTDGEAASPERRARRRRRLLSKKASRFGLHSQQRQVAGGAAADKRYSLAHFQYSKASRFYTTASLLRIFSRGLRNAPPEGAKVVYMHGAWDMLHVGHYAAMLKARELGGPDSYLVVGVHNDERVNRSRGKNYPILNLQERVLSVLGCGYVDDVIIDAPWVVEEEMIASLQIHAVVAGSIGGRSWVHGSPDEGYKVAKAKGIFHVVDTGCEVSVQELVVRVTQPQNQADFVKKYMTKAEKERSYYDERYRNEQHAEGEAAAATAVAGGADAKKND